MVENDPSRTSCNEARSGGYHTQIQAQTHSHIDRVAVVWQELNARQGLGLALGAQDQSRSDFSLKANNNQHAWR